MILCLLEKIDLALRIAQIESNFHRSDSSNPLFSDYLAAKDSFREISPCLVVFVAEEENEHIAGEEETMALARGSVCVRELPQRLPPLRRTKKPRIERSLSNNNPSVPDICEGPSENESITPLPLLATPSSSTMPPPTTPPSSNVANLRFRKYDGSYVTSDEPLLSNRAAASAIARALALKKPPPDVAQRDPADLYDELCASQLDVRVALFTL